MSFDLIVYAPAVPADLRERWEGALRGAGLRCEFPPGFEPRRWEGGYVTVKVEVVPGSFPNAERYGTAPILTAFDFSVSPCEPPDDLAVAEAVAARLKVARWWCSLSTAAGRSVADSRLQWFAAATLAVLTRGVLSDPQQGGYFIEEEAVRQAGRESQANEDDERSRDRWELREWPGWAEPGGTEDEPSSSP